VPRTSVIETSARWLKRKRTWVLRAEDDQAFRDISPNCYSVTETRVRDLKMRWSVNTSLVVEGSLHSNPKPRQLALLAITVQAEYNRWVKRADEISRWRILHILLCHGGRCPRSHSPAAYNFRSSPILCRTQIPITCMTLNEGPLGDCHYRCAD